MQVLSLTYCFVFNAEPDGIGVIADTRLSEIDLTNGISPLPGQVLKVYALRERAFVAIAGRTDHVAMLLHGLRDRMRASDDSKWYDVFVEHCETNFRIYCEAGLFSRTHPPEAALIYGDCRHHRGETKCRAIRLQFGSTDAGPTRRRDNIAFGKAYSIGWSPEGRGPLDEAGKNALGDLYSRSLVISDFSEEEIKELGHMTVEGSPRAGLRLDMTGLPDKSFCPVLRKFAAQTFLRGGPIMAIEPVTLLCGAAEMAIFHTMQSLRAQAVESCAGVGEEFHSASLTLRHGFRVYNGEQLAFIGNVAASIAGATQ